MNNVVKICILAMKLPNNMTHNEQQDLAKKLVSTTYGKIFTGLIIAASGIYTMITCTERIVSAFGDFKRNDAIHDIRLDNHEYTLQQHSTQIDNLRNKQ